MPLDITDNALALLEDGNIQQNIILEINDIPFIFSAVPLTKTITYGDSFVYGDPITYGGTSGSDDNRAYISLDRTTYNIRQQIKSDKKEATSTQQVTVALVDKDQELTALFSPGNTVPDIVGLEARVYISFVGAIHPTDSIRIITGNITRVQAGAGYFLLTISLADDLKRSEIFTQFATNLSGNINDTVTTINFTTETAGQLFADQDAVTTYIRINDELMKVDSIGGSSVIVTRGQLGTVAAPHGDQDDITSYYRIQGNPIDLALKILLSNQGNVAYIENVAVSSFGVTSTGVDSTAILLPVTNGSDLYGLTIGDLVTSTGSANPGSNDFVDGIISGISESSAGTVLNISGASFVNEVSSNAVLSFKSQYNLLPDGCGLSPSQVDVENFNTINTENAGQFFTMDQYIKDTITGKDLINELFQPNLLFQIPRKGRASCGITRPPLSSIDTKTINETNIVNPDRIVIERGTSKNFYNSVVYKFNEDTITNKFLGGEVSVSTTSLDRIKTRNKPLTVEAKGVRDTVSDRTLIQSQSNRILERFQFIAESLKVQVLYKLLGVEIGDSVILDGRNLNITDIKTESRTFQPRVMEVVNRSANPKNGIIELELLDTASGDASSRFGTIGPASIVGTGSTTTEIVLQKSFGTGTALETNKWQDYIGETILVKNEDYSFSEEVTLQSISLSTPDAIIVNPPLSSAPTSGFFVTQPDYGTDTSPLIKSFWKAVHLFTNPTVDILTGVNNTTFTVPLADADKFIIGLPVRVHNDDYTIDSGNSLTTPEPNVLSVDTGTGTIEVDRDLGFTPTAGQKVDLIGYQDGGEPYRIN